MSAQVEVLPPESKLAQGLVALEKYKPDPQVQGVLDRIAGVRVNSRPTKQNAFDLLGLVAEMKQVVRNRWDDLCADAHAHHKKLTTKRSEELKPLDEADSKLRRMISAFDEEERAREAEALRREQERVEAENRRIAEATAKQLEEQHGLAPEEAKVAAEEMAAELPMPPAVAQRHSYSGGGTKAILKAEVVDLGALIKAIASDMRFPSTLLQVNQSALSQFVRAHNGKIDIPGVKISKVSSVYRR